MLSTWRHPGTEWGLRKGGGGTRRLLCTPPGQFANASGQAITEKKKSDHEDYKSYEVTKCNHVSDGVINDNISEVMRCDAMRTYNEKVHPADSDRWRNRGAVVRRAFTFSGSHHYPQSSVNVWDVS